VEAPEPRSHLLVQLTSYRPEYLSILSRDVLRRISAGDDAWEAMVPPAVAELIKRRSFFGYSRSTVAALQA